MSRTLERRERTYNATIAVAITCDKCGGDASNGIGWGDSAISFCEVLFRNPGTAEHAMFDLCPSCANELTRSLENGDDTQ